MTRMNMNFKVGKLISLVIIVLILGIPVVIAKSFSNNTKNKDNVDKEQQFTLDQSNIMLKNRTLIVGKVKVYITKEKKIEEMNVEDYVKGVVCGEMPANFNLEALKAQAVAARTYTLAHMLSLGGSGCGEHKGADLCDTTHCQVYKSKEERLKEWSATDRNKLWEKVCEAVDATSGQVLTYDGELVMSPLYFAISSGKTYDSEEVFASSRPYLKSVDSPGENVLKEFETTVTISNKRLANTINSSYPDAKLSASNLKNQIQVLSRGNGNDVVKIRVGRIDLNGNKFRTALDLKSPDFNFKFSASSVIITCFGAGHGVGMSQWGANIMAQKGSNYTVILTHYYQGVQIDKVKYK